MSPSFMRGVWSLILVVTFAYGGYLFFGSQIMAQSSGSTKPVVIRDVVRAGEHFLSGSLDVGFSCETLRLESTSVAGAYELEFSTWRDPAQVCSPGPILRPFALELFAPSDAHFIATNEGVPMNIVVLRETTSMVRPGALK